MSLRVIGFLWPRNQVSEKGNRFLIGVREGTTVYGIQDKETRYWFYYAYLYEDAAKRVAERLKSIHGPTDKMNNWRASMPISVSSRKLEQLP